MPCASGRSRSPIDRVGLATHVGLPGIRARFASAARFLLATERAADFGAARPNVHVGDAAIAARRATETSPRAQVVREDARTTVPAARRSACDALHRACRTSSDRESGRTSHAARSANRSAARTMVGSTKWPGPSSDLLAAIENRPAVLLALRRSPAIAIHRALIDQRSHQHRRIERIADAHLRVGLREPLLQRRRARLVHQDLLRVVVQRWPAVPTAPKTIARTASSRSADSSHDDRVVAAQFEQRSCQPAAPRVRHAAADGLEPVNEISGKCGPRPSLRRDRSASTNSGRSPDSRVRASPDDRSAAPRAQ